MGGDHLWDAIGAIAETIGAIGILATLIYLARQIKQSAADTRAATAQSVLDRSVANYSDTLMAGVIPTVSKAVLGEEVSRDDKTVAYLWVLRNLQHAELVFIQYKQGNLDREVMESYDRKIITYLSHLDNVQDELDTEDVWQDPLSMFTDSFREHCIQLVRGT